jgi:glutathione S-transferase
MGVYETPMLTLYQAEWCPYSHRVRERLTELGVPFVAKQVAAEREDRGEMRRETGGKDGIPLLVLDDGALVDDWQAIIAHLDAHYPERDDADAHRRKLAEEAEERDPRSPKYPR